ncbi:MAG: gamma carbonic anhydrase family protein [Chloroflexota bacterium]|nr:gamma carbonic anhydrase family protein [Chloroflexota bacterium]MDE3192278.1 gamma carbonic anhydrase family protein [Chloroflexota bacterium]
MPKVADDAWVAPTASIIGDVEIASGASIWFGVTVRADTSYVRIGSGTNVQDNSVIHTDHGAPTIIGANCTIGHGAIVHSSVVGDNVLIGTASVLTGFNKVGSGSLVGAGAVFPAGMEVGERKMVVGVPARVARDVRPEDSRWTHAASEHYREMSAEYRTSVPGGSSGGAVPR